MPRFITGLGVAGQRRRGAGPAYASAIICAKNEDIWDIWRDFGGDWCIFKFSGGCFRVPARRWVGPEERAGVWGMLRIFWQAREAARFAVRGGVRGGVS